MIWLIGFGALFVVFCWIEWRIWTSYAANREESLLWSMRVAVDRGISLPDALLAIAPTFRGRYSAKVVALAMMIEQGVSTPDALSASPGLVSDTTRFLLAAGRSREGLRQLIAQATELQSARRSIAEALIGRLGYFSFILLAVWGLLSFQLMFVVPKFRVIMGDFGVALPGATAFAMGEFGENFSIGILILGTVCAFGLAAIAARWLLGMIGMASYDHAPLGRWLVRTRNSDALRGLSALLSEGIPAHVAVSDLGRLVQGWGLRRRLAVVKRTMEQGKSFDQALRAGKVVSHSEAAALAAGTGVGNVPALLRQIAESTDRRAIYRVRLFIEAITPWVVVLLGVMVAVFCLACFLPLTILIGEACP